MSDRLQRSMALMDAKADVKMIKERTNECWYDTKILANAVYLILEELTATDTADTPQTDRPCDKCEWHKEYGRCIFEYCHYEYEQAHKDTPQTDCGWK